MFNAKNRKLKKYKCSVLAAKDGQLQSRRSGPSMWARCVFIVDRFVEFDTKKTNLFWKDQLRNNVRTSDELEWINYVELYSLLGLPLTSNFPESLKLVIFEVDFFRSHSSFDVQHFTTHWLLLKRQLGTTFEWQFLMIKIFQLSRSLIRKDLILREKKSSN
jgi:hypothetical protein